MMQIRKRIAVALLAGMIAIVLLNVLLYLVFTRIMGVRHTIGIPLAGVATSVLVGAVVITWLRRQQP